ncbi:glycine--tRNA ligase [Candidatus Curtissbacteria bacterium RIFCSPHIGHO2_01_FULL_41_44]|uniref:Glycine--tRNA ligase n=1 Tax=Candidatus Curtissbacteria bacterium RIFCSPLOWO2_01_FULL_42_50 TaxID=1797730 RepID=A0A1F5H3E0_9BACT|nr:MAG: glycine--tRNA ligase [Candidatus Curtissbacteria bacterium RIFCSPHIGHO2_02_FULL_42_58]OGD94532.1 MAG: glycine--tRNA ligase [Candidatus Curtissbacteria bacterium RIFCSPHIGHO2_01_FULL_41_44]OGD97917.1 MAG: glycine--tRNA ligase [Candidatus Curtissbacteria bacterium RIFCSPHIGHO2_12_FULL_42_33]OGD98565.1 MAG: glycine--tRNA ligase [Candidatus Curtissbacteria bacterium RIFCSPLOWO2_01_FULL_42_50]OGE02142.1 MAG: glycine--tRNA ligase [Candidatus Curtissbacteria bacterium RIFCSPLOWO2_12_FULL_41_16
MSNLMDKIVSLAKRRGFIYPGSEIYGGLAGTWDYGPLGVELKNNIRKAFWQSIVYERKDVVGFDAAILMNPKVWEASGHVQAFTDPLVECKICHQRLRADQEDEIKDHEKSHKGQKVTWTERKKFNLLVEAKLGVVEDERTKVYLRGEITQGVHVNFKNILDSTRLSIPFGIAQIGKAFRNEITPGNFTFRSREFEQMELQYYVRSEESESKKWYEYWKQQRMDWYVNLGMTRKKLRFRQHEESERAHYARDAWDIEYDSPFGWKEFEGIHNRGDWDLSRHQKHSGVDLTYFDQESNKHYLPWIIETSGGVDRAALFFLIDAYTEESTRSEPGSRSYSEPGSEDSAKRIVLKLHPKLAPYKVAVFPLLANKPDLVQKARSVYQLLTTNYQLLPVAWDDRGNIGKRYYSQDEIGTPYCVTIDFQTLDDDTVTIRDRDTTKQERVKIEELTDILESRLQR